MVRLIEVIFFVLAALAGGYYLGLWDARMNRTPAPISGAKSGFLTATLALVSDLLWRIGKIALFLAAFAFLWLVGMFIYQYLNLS